MPCGLPTRSYLEAILVLAAAVAWQCTNALEPLGACNALRAANPQLFWIHLVLAMPCGNPQMFWNHFVPCELSATTLEPFGADIALRAANPQMPWGHLVFVMSCAIPQMLRSHSVLEFAAGRQPADGLGPFGI